VRGRTDGQGAGAYSGPIARHIDRAYYARRTTMNEDQVKGKLKDIGGKIQEEAGKLVDSPETQAKGLKNQVEGKTQEKYGDAKETLKDGIDRV
jgi:uncharacterized protein YjbJ (UPF0337 family)